MTEGRIPRLPVEEAKAAAESAGVPAQMADLSIFQVLLRHAPLARRFSDFLGYLLFENRLDGRLRELVIMRIGWVTASEYEWAQHWRVGPFFGADHPDLLAVRSWEDHDGFGPAERAVLAATDEVLTDGAVSAPTWEACRSALDDDVTALLELVFAIGCWRMVSEVLRSLEVPLEDGVDPWPPDGQAP